MRGMVRKRSYLQRVSHPAWQKGSSNSDPFETIEQSGTKRSWRCRVLVTRETMRTGG